MDGAGQAHAHVHVHVHLQTGLIARHTCMHVHVQVKPVFKYFETRTPDTLTEVQEHTMTWHFQACMCVCVEACVYVHLHR